MAGRREGIPGDVEPAVAGQQLVGVFADLQEFDEIPELRGILRPDVGSLAEKMLRCTDAPNFLVDFIIAKARVDDDRSGYDACRFEKQMTAVGQIDDNLHRRDVLRILPEVEKLTQLKMLGEPYIVSLGNHNS